jgi:hypothetical protein
LRIWLRWLWKWNWWFLGRRIVNDLSVAKDHDAKTIPMLLLIPGVGGFIDILTDRGNRLPHYIVYLCGLRARDLEILHFIVKCVFFNFLLVEIAVNFISIGSN